MHLFNRDIVTIFVNTDADAEPFDECLINAWRSYVLFFVFVALSASQPQAQVGGSGERVLFVGNSITIHPPVPEIGSTGSWGMAASAAEVDYVHLVVEGIAKTRGRRPQFRAVNLANFERAYESFDLVSGLTEQSAFQPDTVIVALGENAAALNTDEAKANFKDAIVRLLTLLKKNNKTSIYVRSCFWPDAAKDAAMKQACGEVGGVFIDIGALSKDDKNYARSERGIAHQGIAAHPGDHGMRAIADLILAARKANWASERLRVKRSLLVAGLIRKLSLTLAPTTGLLGSPLSVAPECRTSHLSQRERFS